MPAASQVQQAPVQQERTFTQAELNEIVGKRAIAAREKGRQEGRQEVTQQYSQAPQAESHQSSMGGVRQPEYGNIEDLIARRTQETVAKALPEHLNQERARIQTGAILDQFNNKLANGFEKYKDNGFSEKWAQDIKPVLEQSPNLVMLLASTDNMHDVLNDFAENPYKIAQLKSMAEDPATRHLAQKELNKLVSTLKQNEAAASRKVPNPPLDRLSPSNAGKDNGVPTVKDMRFSKSLRPFRN